MPWASPSTHIFWLIIWIRPHYVMFPALIHKKYKIICGTIKATKLLNDATLKDRMQKTFHCHYQERQIKIYHYQIDYLDFRHVAVTITLVSHGEDNWTRTVRSPWAIALVQFKMYDRDVRSARQYVCNWRYTVSFSSKYESLHTSTDTGCLLLFKLYLGRSQLSIRTIIGGLCNIEYPHRLRKAIKKFIEPIASVYALFVLGLTKQWPKKGT